MSPSASPGPPTRRGASLNAPARLPQIGEYHDIADGIEYLPQIELREL
jgi:hypothetical protein